MGCRLARLLVVLATTLLVACGRVEPPEKTNELVIGILPGPTTYQESAGVVSGFEYDLIESFAASLKLKTRYLVFKDQAALLNVLRRGKIHVAAGVPLNSDLKLVFSPPIRESKQVLVGNDEDWSPEDLAGSTIEVLANTPQVETLRKLAGEPPAFVVREVESISDQELLQRAADNKVALVASDMLNYRLAVNLSPDLVVAKELPDTILSSWAFLPTNAALAKKADDFIAQVRQDGSLARLQDRYFGHIQRIKADGVAHYIHDIHTVLPYFRRQFEAAQVSTGIDWRLIAALAYQESKWDPLATSFTNVRGLMMLTEETADRMGVDNRLDAQQSARAGGRYLLMLKDELPDEVAEPDRTWFALAAYNLGMGHLNGARTFAKQMKRDPNSWYDMKKVLPLMSQPQFYNRLKAGPARGGEAVVLVENVRNYYDILCRLEPAWQPTPLLTELKMGSKRTPGSARIGELRIGAGLRKDAAKVQLRLPENTAETFGEPRKSVDRDVVAPPAESHEAAEPKVTKPSPGAASAPPTPPVKPESGAADHPAP